MGRKKKEVTDIEDSLNEKPIERDLKFVSSGSTNLNLALTNSLDNGYPVGKIVNLVGDKQLGKSLLCLEVMMYAHYKLRKNYDIKMIYNDVESALNTENAVQIGFPIDAIEFRKSPTMEHWQKDLEIEAKNSDKYDLVIYVLDSLDAISTETELEQEIGEKTYGMDKQKKLSEFFRKLTQKIDNKNILLIVVSQIRENIGVSFGEKHRRSGGKALDFYASQIIWLYNKGQMKNGNVTTGIEIKAKVKKNRAWKPFRECDFNILFEYGIDDLGSMVDFLIDNKYYMKSGSGKIQLGDKTISREDLIQYLSENNQEQETKDAVKMVWDKIEEDAKVIRKPKYEDIMVETSKLNHQGEMKGLNMREKIVGKEE